MAAHQGESVLRQSGSIELATDISFGPRPSGVLVPLADSELRTWNAMYVNGRALSIRLCAMSVRIVGPLRADILQTSIGAVIQRHESLRARFVLADGIPRQQIDPPTEYRLNVVDLQNVQSVQLQQQLQDLVREFIDEQVDLSAGPLFDAKLFRLNDREHVLIVVVPHVVSDAVSFAILGREIWTAYNKLRLGLPISLPKLRIQFLDFVFWRQRMYGDWLQKHCAYWREHMAGAAHIRFPRDSRIEKGHEAIGSLMHFSLGKNLTDRLRELADREHARLGMVVLSLYAALMAFCCDEDDLVIALISRGRHIFPELESTIGPLATHLYLRIKVFKGESFIALLKQVNREVCVAYQNWDFGRLSDLIPGFSTELQFNWQPASSLRTPPIDPQDIGDVLRIMPYPFKVTWAPETPMMMFYDNVAGISLTVVYRSDLFTRLTVERLGNSLRSVAAEFVRCPNEPIMSAFTSI